MKKIFFFVFLTCVLAATSCKKFLEQEPDNRTNVTSPTQVTQLLTSAYPKASYFAFAEAMSDNSEDKGQGVPGINPDLIKINLQSFMFEDVQSTETDSPEAYWDSCYRAIAAANHALEVINNVRTDTASYRAQKGEALVARAYAHFMLVTFFSKAYDPATAGSDPGIPYVTAPEKVVFGQYERKTVQYVYDMIENDLTAGIALIQDKNYGDATKFHFTQKAAHAFASRFYLFKRDYAKVLDEANKTLPNSSAVASELRPWNPTYVNYPYEDLRIQYTKSSEPANILLQEVITNWTSGNYYGLRYGLYSDVHDIILNGPNVTGGTLVIGFRVFGAEPKYYNIPKFFGTNGISIEPLLTSEEVLSNRAEANVRLNNYDAALVDLNAWASRNVRNYNASTHNITQKKITDFWAQSIDIAMINTILFFRQAFFMHEGVRWLDILRLKIPVTHRTVDNKTIVLGPDDKRRVIQIPAQVKLSGMEQNPR